MSDSLTAVIGGSGLYSLSVESGFELLSSETLDTPYAKEITIERYQAGAGKCLFIPRHGKGHDTPPHLVNYRSNIWALNELGVTDIIAVNAVGGITQQMSPGSLVIPDQIIDYTWGRESTFHDGLDELENHIDFTYPYDQPLRDSLIKALTGSNVDFVNGGVYGCTQGPRLETAAEIRRLARDGCNIVGMTAMPEAALAREVGIAFASVALVVNWAAGVKPGETITMDAIMEYMQAGLSKLDAVLFSLLAGES